MRVHKEGVVGQEITTDGEVTVTGVLRLSAHQSPFRVEKTTDTLGLQEGRGETDVSLEGGVAVPDTSHTPVDIWGRHVLSLLDLPYTRRPTPGDLSSLVGEVSGVEGMVVRRDDTRTTLTVEEDTTWSPLVRPDVTVGAVTLGVTEVVT